MHFLRFKSQLTQKKIANYRKFPQEWLILSTKMIQKWPPFVYTCLYKKLANPTSVASWYLGNVQVKPISKHSAPPPKKSLNFYYKRHIMQLFTADATIFKKNVFGQENCPQRLVIVGPNFFSVLLLAANVAKNWKSISEIELKHPLLYLLCGCGHYISFFFGDQRLNTVFWPWIGNLVFTK